MTSIADYAGTWTLDAANTSIEFDTKAMWVFGVKGTARALSGSATVGADGAISGTFVIDAASVDTKNKKRDEHLRTADFFEIDVYPTIDFEITGGRLVDSGTAELSGQLTIHGQTHPITVTGGVAGSDSAVTLTIEVNDLDRLQWGLDWTKLGANTHNRITIRAPFSKS